MSPVLLSSLLSPVAVSLAVSPALAQAAPAQGGGSWAPIIINIGLIFAIWYFLVIRPQRKQRQRHEQALLNLHKGDEIVTSGGLVGEVVHIKEAQKDGQPQRTLADRVTVKSGEARVVVERGRIAKVSSPGGGESKAG